MPCRPVGCKINIYQFTYMWEMYVVDIEVEGRHFEILVAILKFEEK